MEQHNDTANIEEATMECRRCGVCCTIHQAFVTTEDIEHIIAYLGITPDEWKARYDDVKWQYSEYHLIRHVNGACAFLRYEDGLATCAIHAAKPECCSKWRPRPDRKECRAGLEKAKRKV